MSKEEVLWVAIRIFGVYLLVNVVIEIPKLIGHGTQVVLLGQYSAPCVTDSQSGDRRSLSEELDSTWGALRRAAWASFVGSLTRVIVVSIVSVYLLRGGGVIYRLMRLPAPTRLEDPSPTAE